jgi:hypothetical protein
MAASSIKRKFIMRIKMSALEKADILELNKFGGLLPFSAIGTILLDWRFGQNSGPSGFWIDRHLKVTFQPRQPTFARLPRGSAIIF